MRPVNRTWVEVSQSALTANFEVFRRLVGTGVNIAPVLKANAYGHGMLLVAETLKKRPIWGFCVAHGEEALTLRPHFRGRILVMSSWLDRELPYILRHKIEIVAWDRESWRTIVRISARLKQPAAVHLKLDTGTSRIGFLPVDTPWLLRQLQSAPPTVKIAGIFSHLANAEDAAAARTTAQVNAFRRWLGSFDRWPGERHIACTAAALRYPFSRLTVVRLGIGLYGYLPSSASRAWFERSGRACTLRPAMGWYTRVIQVKRVRRGQAIGYKGTAITRRPTILAVLPVGYADGYPWRLSNRGFVLINGRRAPILGRICMNLMMADVTRIPGVQSGTIATLIGPGLSPEEFCRFFPIAHYELPTGIHPSIPRLVVP